MTQKHYTPRRRKFQHLTKEKRAQLEMLLKLKPKLTQREMADMLGISRSTLNAEIKRGTAEQLDTNLKPYRAYFADVGQRVYEEHRENSVKPFKLAEVSEFLEYAEKEILVEKHSPDVICGSAKVSKKFGDKIVCTKTLYNYIDLCLLKVRNIDLPLRTKRKTKVKRARQNRRIFGESIENRPIEINNRLEFGHWEIDTVVGTKETSPVFLTLDERISRYRIMVKIESRSAEAVNKAMKKIMRKYGKRSKEIFKSITSDNGSEFAKLQAAVKKTKIYYAHPYSSFERGLNEKHNSLVRRFFPKGKSFKNVVPDAVRRVQDWINNLPRKSFNYATPNLIFLDYVNNL